MDTQKNLEQLRTLARDSKNAGRGARLRRALLTLAIPATAALATACYGVPMSEAPYVETTMGPVMHLDGVDCDGDGIPESPDEAYCSYGSRQ
jgi:hypothetical protein